VIGFSHASQNQVASWGKRLAADYGQSAELQFFEIAMLQDAPRILRGMIIKKMGSSVPQNERSHFLRVTRDQAAWRQAVRYSKPDDAYVVLTAGDGQVLWHTEGEASDASYRALQDAIAEHAHR